jgi:alkylation response protein AidB-like acyl-CoA dehydrogenase
MTSAQLKPLPPDTLGPELAVAPERSEFRQRFRSWLHENAPRIPAPLDERANFEHRREWQRTLHEGGWASPSWQTEFGGLGTSPVEQFIYYEELALARAPVVVNESGILLLGPTLMVHGTGELQRQFLPGIASGEDIWCQGFSEPNAGSDLAALRARAVREGDEWVITGQKIWTTWAKYSQWCFVLCRTEAGSERHRGLSMLIVGMDQATIDSRPIRQITGDSDFSEVFFDGARTPLEFTVGAPGQGWEVAMTLLRFERADQGYTDHARLLAALADARQRLRMSVADDQIGASQAYELRLRIADLWARCQQLRRFNLRTAMRSTNGMPAGLESSAIKLHWTRLTKDMAELSIEIDGADGLRAGARVAHELLASRAHSIYSGTDEIQRNIVAERILGLPR